MEFFFSCSTWHLTRSLRSLVSYRVKHSKRNSISSRVHVLFSICYTLRLLFSTGVLVWRYLEGEKSSVDKLIIYQVIYFSYCTRSHAKRRIQSDSHSNCFGKTRSRHKSMEVAFSNWWLKYDGEPIYLDKDFDKSLKQRNERHHPKKRSC